jgi:polar amino acid transport system substrate-binding protein
MGKYLMVLLMTVFLSVSDIYAEKDVLHVVYTQWEPYTYQKNEKDSGFEIETVKAVAEKMGLLSKFEQLPWKRCLLAMENGQADALVSALKTPERETFLYYPDEFISLSKTIFLPKKEAP